MKSRYDRDQTNNRDTWRAYDGRNGPNESLNASNRRKLMATWLDEAWDEMVQDTDFLGSFFSTGCLMERDGTNRINLVGLEQYTYSRNERLALLARINHELHEPELDHDEQRVELDEELDR